MAKNKEHEMSVRYLPGMDFWAYKGMKDREEESDVYPKTSDENLQ